MKISKLIATVSVISIAAAIFTTAPATAACYWQPTGNGDEQILVVDSTGQCTIDFGAPFVDPNAGSTPTPSAPSTQMPPTPPAPSTPVTEATPTPTPTPSAVTKPTLPAIPAKPVKVPMVKHSIGATAENINFVPAKFVQIVDEVDSTFSTTCFYAASCSLEMPADHSWKYSIVNDYYIIAELAGEALNTKLLPPAQSVYGEVVIAGRSDRKTNTNIYYETFDSKLSMNARTDKETQIKFGSASENISGALKLELGESVSIFQTFKTAKKITWSGLPAGLVQAEDGTISGMPSSAGYFEVSGAFGTTRKPYSYKFGIQVSPGVEIPGDLKVTSVDLTTAKVTLKPSATNDPKTIPSLYEFEVKNLRTLKSELKYLEGSFTEGTLRGFLPGDSYSIRVRALKAIPLRYSAFSAPYTLKAQAAAQYFKKSPGTAPLTQTWLEDSSTKLAVTIANKAKGSVQLSFNTKTLPVTKAQASVFNKYYSGLYMNRSGSIVGSVDPADVKKKPLSITLGTIDFVFKFDVVK